MERSIEQIGMKPESDIIVYALHYDNGEGGFPVARVHSCTGDYAQQLKLEELLWEEGRRFVKLSAESAANGHPAPTTYILWRSVYRYNGVFELQSSRVLAALSAGKEKEWRGEE